MRAYYHDALPSDPRLPHISPTAPPVTDATLKAIGVLHWSIPVNPAIPVDPSGACDPGSIPVESEGGWEAQIDAVARERGYKNRDVVESSREIMGEAFDEKMRVVYEE